MNNPALTALIDHSLQRGATWFGSREINGREAEEIVAEALRDQTVDLSEWTQINELYEDGHQADSPGGWPEAEYMLRSGAADVLREFLSQHVPA